MGAWAGMALPDLSGVMAGVTVVALPPRRLMATYYDTADLRLARWGVTLRHRTAMTEEGSSGGPDASGGPVASGGPDEAAWTLKLPTDDAVPEGGLARHELGFNGGPGRVPAAAVQMVRAFSRSAPLGPVARLRTDRLRLELRDADGSALAELDDDEVSVLVSGPTGRGRRLAARFREIEIELASGADPAVLAATVARLRSAGAGAPDPTPKVVRALGPRALAAPDVTVVAAGRHSSAGEAVRAAIGGSVVRLIRHDPGARLGDDPEDVHQARVATRRLRSDLRTLRPLLDDEWAAGLREELGWLADLLGGVRDTDVLLERVQRHAGHLPAADAKGVDRLLRQLKDERDVARQALIAGMDSARYTELLDRLVAAAAGPVFALPEAADPPPAVGDPSAAEAPAVGDPPAVEVGAGAATRILIGPGPEATPAIDLLPALVRRPWRHLAQAVAALGPQPADDALHDIRIRAKRCRYAAEVAVAVVGKPAARLGVAVAEVQSVLGDFHDAIVAEEWLRAAAAGGPANVGLAAGQLIAIERGEAAASRARWTKAWAAASSKKLRTWLD